MTQEDLHGYEPAELPFALDFGGWSTSKAREYFDWFVQNIERRVGSVQRTLHIGGYNGQLDYTGDSLFCLGAFLKGAVRTRLLSPSERAEQRQELSGQIPRNAVDPVLDIAGGWALDDLTLSLCLDSGAYFGEVLRNAHQSVEWALWTRRTIELNRPALVGFARGEPLDPVGITEGAALGMAKGKHDSSRLHELFDIWSGRVDRDA